MKNLCILTLFLLLFIEGKAQFFVPNKALVQMLEDKPLLVIATPDALGELTKKFALQLWKANPSVTCLSPRETDRKLDREAGKYAVLSWYFTQRTSPFAGVFESKEVFVLGLQLHGEGTDDFVTVHEIAFPDSVLAAYDVAFALQQLQIDLEAGANKMYAEDKAFWNRGEINTYIQQYQLFLPDEKQVLFELFFPESQQAACKFVKTADILQTMQAHDSTTFFVTQVFSDTHFEPIFVLVSSANWEPVLFLTFTPMTYLADNGSIVPLPQSPYNSEY
ncbi:MAG: hypothetical protein H7Y04_10225 [Verrucomicrobia bacterium]|nr:hypothetical protein [Cytophagales bacterium]